MKLIAKLMAAVKQGWFKPSKELPSALIACFETIIYKTLLDDTKGLLILNALRIIRD